MLSNPARFGKFATPIHLFFKKTLKKMALLTIVIGIVFVMLLFSLLATTIMEMIAGLFSLRGQHLLSAIQDMIGTSKTKFMRHPYFEQLTIGSNLKIKGRALPSYLSSWNFSAILTDILEMDGTESIADRIGALPAGRLRDILTFLYNQTGENLDAFKKKVEEWFNEVMDRASGAYKRKARTYLFLIGLVVALVFNVDVITIYHNLSVNTSLRDFVADQATTYVNTNPAPSAAATPDYAEAKAKIGVLINDNIEALSSPLGLGWEQVDQAELFDPKWWLYHLAGWLTTAFAVSLGASFWFDLLRRLVSMRSSGPPPASQTVGETAQAQPPVPTKSFLTTPGSDSPLESFRATRKPIAPPKGEKDEKPKNKPKPDTSDLE
jgi:hypothetical protein